MGCGAHRDTRCRNSDRLRRWHHPKPLNVAEQAFRRRKHQIVAGFERFATPLEQEIGCDNAVCPWSVIKALGPGEAAHEWPAGHKDRVARNRVPRHEAPLLTTIPIASLFKGNCTAA